MENTIVSAGDAAATGATAISTESATPTTPAGSRSRKETCKDKDDTEDEAIVQCMKAWNYAYKKEAANLDEGESDYPAEKKGNQAFLRDTPPLVGLKNICQFIACINFASMNGIISQRDAVHYLANARVALAALSLQPKPQATGAKSLGKPSANPAGNVGE
ncbi:MAG: hypothetical protein WDM87_05235 [Terracidiphilus sp.]